MTKKRRIPPELIERYLREGYNLVSVQHNGTSISPGYTHNVIEIVLDKLVRLEAAKKCSK